MPSDATVLVCTIFSLAAAGAVFSAKTAALRGTGGEPFPPWLDKLCRLAFLALLFLPIAAWELLPRVPLAISFLAYLPSFLDGTEKTGTRVSPWVRDWAIWRWFKRRLGLKIIRTVPLDPQKQYIFGVHPHGILPFGAMINFCTNVNGAAELLSVEVRVLAASFCFYVPFYRDLLLAGGGCDAARYCARGLLETHGKSLMLVPGGATEALYASKGRHTLVLRKRRGFVRLAMQTGAALVPSYSFGENDTYTQFSSDSGLISKAKKSFQAVFGISLPLISNVLPHKCDITSVIGKPIEVAQVKEPTDEQVAALLERYIAAVTALFDEHKQAILGDDFTGKLEIL